ncbi:hypothetical protein HAX44_07580 [Enterococcus faecalis]|nr:hypothetical protein [Enterococcus faecalis]MBF0005474.1 hypothetical protein [Enterococcus faecalis]MBF0008157.1 hypothetical protein [Enterococcus faecalis]
MGKPIKLQDEKRNSIVFAEVKKISKKEASVWIEKGYRIFKSGLSYYACK